MAEVGGTGLTDTTLIYVSPAPQVSGVGDYAVDFLDEIRPHFREVVEIWCDTDGPVTARQLVRSVRDIEARAGELARRGPVIVHFEQSAGSLIPFWGAMALRRRVPVTATVHDAPQPVWWPFDTRLVKGHRLLHHAVHYPFRFIVNHLQRRMCDGPVLFALTSVGATQVALRQPGADARATRHIIPARPPLRPLQERPLAVGMFGHLYKGKGFDKIDELRAGLDDDIELVIAGRGTEALAPRAGVTVLGEVNGAEEDRFFDSIRLLVVPYTKDNYYGRAWTSSGSVARSFSYGTPILCTLNGALSETATEGGAVGVDGVAEIPRRANALVRDDDALAKLAREISALSAERTMANCAAPFLAAWTELAEKTVTA